jgi:hypothetical protein
MEKWVMRVTIVILLDAFDAVLHPVAGDDRLATAGLSGMLHS